MAVAGKSAAASTAEVVWVPSFDSSSCCADACVGCVGMCGNVEDKQECKSSIVLGDRLLL